MPTSPVNLSGNWPRMARAAAVALSFCAVLLMGSAVLPGPVQASPSATSQYKIPMQSFLSAYLNGMYDNHYNTPSGFHIPSIMLFSPDGKMLAQAIDDTSLAALKNTFQTRADTPAQAGLPGVAIFDGILAKSAGIAADSFKAPDSKQWTAIILSSNNPACASCKKFEKAFTDMQKNDPAQLHAVDVLLTN